MSTAPRDPAAGFEQLLDYRLQLLERLERQPADFAARVAEVPAATWHEPRDAQGHSLLRVAAHVRDVEVRIYRPCIRRILAEDQPRLTSVPTHNEAAATLDLDETMTAILTSWSQARAELAHWLRPLEPRHWSRTGFYPPAGIRTVQWWVEQAYGHAREHENALLDSALRHPLGL